MLDPSLTATPLRLGLVGATGAMGRRVLRLLPEIPRLRLEAVLIRAESQNTAQGLVLGSHPQALCTQSPAEMAERVDVVVDFSAPAQCAVIAPHLARTQCAYVVASTGLDAPSEAALNSAACSTAILQAANLSLGVQVLTQLVQEAAHALARAGSWDAEIVELHHRRKTDGPSGTALALGAALERGDPGHLPRVGRADQTAVGRPNKELGYSVVRGGDVAGEHTVYFLGAGERLELIHRSQSADIFARGALTACLRLYGATPGRYTLQNLPVAARP